MNVIRLIATREVKERLRAKSFYILTGLLVAVIVALGVINRVVGDDGPGTLHVGVVGDVAAGFEPALDSSAAPSERSVELASFPDAAAARADLDDGGIDALVVVADRQLVFANDVDEDDAAIVQQAWATVAIQASLLEAGLTESEAAQALSPQPLETVTLDPDEDDDEPSGLSVLAGTMAAILLFISLQTFGGYVLIGVVEEKASAVVEVLMVRAGADQLLAGKVIGIGIAALLQFAAAVAAGLVSLTISGTEVPGAIWSALPTTLVWFLGGYALYSTLFALAGSLVSRQEDAQAASAPIMTALIGAYMLVFIVGYVPDALVTRIMSMIPFIAPMLMPMRMAAGAALWWEILVALIGLVLATYAAWKLAGRIYEQGLLRRGSRVTWRDALARTKS